MLSSFIDHAVSRYMATEAIEHNLRRFQRLVEDMADVVEVVDSDHVIRYANPAVERHIGRKPEEFIGTKMQAHLEEHERLEGIRTRCWRGNWRRPRCSSRPGTSADRSVCWTRRSPGSSMGGVDLS